MANNYKVSAYNPVLTYEKFDVVYDQVGTYRYYYATQNVKTYQNPTGLFNFPITSWTREQDAVTIQYTYSGAESLFSIGSIVRVTGLVNSTVNYTGMIIDAASGWVKYTNQGYPETSSVSVGAINCNNPAWTTGFYFVPSYSSSLESKQNVITAQFGDGYSQRQRGALNNNMQSWKLAFNERSDKESKAIFTFTEDHGGADAVKIMMPLNKFQNDPNLKYVIANPQISTTYFNLNNISLTATQVFDI
jgi:phage-related protein